MKGKSVFNWQKEYKALKGEFDELLQKNQNDLIKIKIRQKQLQDKIACMQKENQELKEEIQTLRTRLIKSIETSQSKEMQEDNRNLRKIVEQKEKDNCTLSKQILEKTKEFQKKTKILAEQLQKEKKNQKILEKCVKELKEKVQQTNEENKKMEKKYNEACDKVAQLQKSANQFNEELKMERQELYREFAQKDSQIAVLQSYVKTYKQQLENVNKKECSTCRELIQELQLQKQMVKSARMMVKVKEMELQSLKK